MSASVSMPRGGIQVGYYDSYEQAQAAARVRARIAMRPGVDSLGVAAAAAVAFATIR